MISESSNTPSQGGKYNMLEQGRHHNLSSNQVGLKWSSSPHSHMYATRQSYNSKTPCTLHDYYESGKACSLFPQKSKTGPNETGPITLQMMVLAQ